MTQSEFARYCGVHRQLVYQWERGKSKPSDAIMEYLGIRVKYVVARKQSNVGQLEEA